MDPKQTQLKNLLIEYFLQRSDTEIQPGKGGTYRVTLKSEVAQTDFGGLPQLNLVFDSERAYEHPGSILVTPSHPFLEVIRNDFNRDYHASAQLADAHVFLQLLDPTGNIRIPYLSFSGNFGFTTYHLSYRASIVLTYRVVYETDERSENIVRLCYDAISGTLQSALAAKLPSLFLAKGVPPEVNDTNANILDILNAGRSELEQRVKVDAQAMAEQVNKLLQDEKLRLTEYYQTEINRERDHVTREQLRTRLEKDIAELEQKLTCRIRIQLLSLLRLWWPTVHYSQTISGSHGDFEIKNIIYDVQTGKTEFWRCEVCGNQTQYDICITGKHVLCGAICSHGLQRCATCHDNYCSEHGSICHDCSEPVCQHDRQECSYGKHSVDTYFCPKCLVPSFENHLICKECLEYCELCHRPFPHDRMAVCRIGGEHICKGHRHSPDGFICQECGQVTCKTHGVRTADRKWACQDHALITTCCHKVYAKSQLVTCCVDTKEVLCPEHHVKCYGCGQAVCEKHRSPYYAHPDQFLCHNCRRICDSCDTSQTYLAVDLIDCQICGKPLCNQHRQICVVGNEIVCQDHARISIAGEPLCIHHAGHCVQCGTESEHPFYRVDRLYSCSICHETLCNLHSATCVGCGQTVCEKHRWPRSGQTDEFICEQCRRVCDLCGSEYSYLAIDLNACHTCGKPVCDKHRHYCAVGGEVVCDNDVHMSIDHEPLCEHHARHCVICETEGKGTVYRADHLHTCAVCHKEVCKAHSRLCPICQTHHMCNIHVSAQSTCAGCGRPSCGAARCRANSHRCQKCGLFYCRHCIDKQGCCLACNTMRQTSLNDKRLTFLRSISTGTDAETAKLLDKILGSPAQLSVYASINHTYEIIVLRYTPSWYQLLRSTEQIRLVVSHTGKIVKITREASEL